MPAVAVTASTGQAVRGFRHYLERAQSALYPWCALHKMASAVSSETQTSTGGRGNWSGAPGMSLRTRAREPHPPQSGVVCMFKAHLCVDHGRQLRMSQGCSLGWCCANHPLSPNPRPPSWTTSVCFLDCGLVWHHRKSPHVPGHGLPFEDSGSPILGLAHLRRCRVVQLWAPLCTSGGGCPVSPTLQPERTLHLVVSLCGEGRGSAVIYHP